MLLFEWIFGRCVNTLPPLKRTDRADGRFTVPCIPDIERRQSREVHRDEIGRRQRPNEVGERADHSQRLHAADVILVELFVIERPHRIELLGSAPVPAGDVSKARHRHGDAIVEDLEVGCGQILDVAAIAPDDRRIDQHDVRAAAECRQRRRLRRRLHEEQCYEQRRNTHGDWQSFSAGASMITFRVYLWCSVYLLVVQAFRPAGDRRGDAEH